MIGPDPGDRLPPGAGAPPGRVSDHPAMAELERAALADVFDLLRSGVFVLDERGRVIVHNRAAAALLDAADGLSLTAAGGLAAAGEGDAAELGLLRDACAAAEPRTGGALQVHRGSGRRAYALLVSPLAGRVTAGARRASAVVFVTDLDQQRAPAGALRGLFGLTAAELRVAELVARGERAADIARGLHLALPTVRTHLTRLLDKTGARSQPDLVRILMTSAPGLTR